MTVMNNLKMDALIVDSNVSRVVNYVMLVLVLDVNMVGDGMIINVFQFVGMGL